MVDRQISGLAKAWHAIQFFHAGWMNSRSARFQAVFGFGNRAETKPNTVPDARPRHFGEHILEIFLHFHAARLTLVATLEQKPTGQTMTRRYPGQERCPIARTLGVVGDSWTFLVLRELLLKGERRYTDLNKAFPSMSPNILSARLKKLEHHGVVERRLHDQHPPRITYRVTGKGKALRSVLDALSDWGTEFTE